MRGSPSDITLGRIMEALGGRMYDPAFCGRHAGEVLICVNSSACSVRSLWGVLDGLVGGVLHRIRLADLLGNEGQVTFSLRQHLESTIDQMLGQQSSAGPVELPAIGS